MYDTMKDRQIGIAEVIEKWGVPPEKMIDLQALTGDSTDNVPGVPGIGPKTAAQLLEEYGDLDTLLARASEIKQNKRRENLIEFADQARLSRELVTLKDDTPVDARSRRAHAGAQDGPKLIAFLKAMEFNTLTRRVAEATGTDASEIEPAQVEVEAGAAAHGPDLDEGRPSASAEDADDGRRGRRGRRGGVDAGGACRRARDSRGVGEIRSSTPMSASATPRRSRPGSPRRARPASSPSTPRPTSLDPMQAELVGFSLARRARRGRPMSRSATSRRRRPARRRAGGGPDPDATRRSRAEAAAGGPVGPQDRARTSSIDWLVMQRSRHRRSPPSTTRC